MERSGDRVGHLEDSDPTDLDLLKQVADGDEVAFGLLATRLGPTLRRVLFRLGLTAPIGARLRIHRVWELATVIERLSSACIAAIRLARGRRARSSRGAAR